MNHAVKKMTSAALALAMALSMGVMTHAASATDYSVNFADNSIQLIRDGKTAGTYSSKNSNISLTQNKSGQLLVTFTNASSGKTTGINLASQTEITLGGTYGTLTVAAPVAVSLADGSKIDSLQVTNSKASVNVSAKATVTKAGAVSGAKVTGITGVTTIKGGTTTTASKPTTPATSAASKPSSSTTSSGVKEAITVNMNDADDVKSTKEINYLSDRTIELVAKAGISLGAAMRDVDLEVERKDDGSKVTGRWEWVDASSTTKTSGTYTYRFTPSLSAKYNPVEITVKFSSSGESRSLSKPGIKISGSTHGKGDFTVEVTVPNGVEDDDIITLYVDGDEYDEQYVDEDDAGDKISFKVEKSGDFDDGDKIKVKAKISRSKGGSGVTSRTVTYTVDLGRDK